MKNSYSLYITVPAVLEEVNVSSLLSGNTDMYYCCGVEVHLEVAGIDRYVLHVFVTRPTPPTFESAQTCS